MSGRDVLEDPTMADSSIDYSDDGDIHDDDNGGDYSTRFEELMSGGEEEEDQEEEEGFFYAGVDADPSAGYKEQLRDVLGPDHEGDELDEAEVERSLLHEVEENERFASSMEDEARHIELQSDHSRSETPQSQSELPSISHAALSDPSGSALGSHKPFINPTISRLRSVNLQASRTPSASSLGVSNNDVDVEAASASHSHFSQLSRGSASPSHQRTAKDDDREVFLWTKLQQTGDVLYGIQAPSKASSILGSASCGSPTVLAANGLICIGTDTGVIAVFDFKQTLRCICGEGTRIGPVTALALSFDHTFIASGHATGHIQLFDLRNPRMPARFVESTSLAVVASGRQEGHLLGSRIVGIGFVAGRHTAIVSADDRGLAFYHSLGKVLFVEASDILRILGKYPDQETPTSGPGGRAHPFRRKKHLKVNGILAVGPLPLGTCRHPTDTYNLIALLTPVKLVIVGLKPTPKTWYRRHREGKDEKELSKPTRSRARGTLAWYPSVELEHHNGKSNTTPKEPVPSTSPMLIYSWGNTIHLLRVSESKIMQKTKSSRTGKVKEVEVGRIVFDEVGWWTVENDILALQWLNVNQIIIVTTSTLEVHDVQTRSYVEGVPFQAWTLASPMLGHTINGAISYPDAVSEVAHSMRVYKGKIFLLGQQDIQVGTLLTWADRILSFVESGEFLKAIDLARSYYVGEAPGNRNGLPDNPDGVKSVVGEKMRELMVASADYAFSEDRFTDGTHVTPDGRGVDRTSLFEGLVSTCGLASIALQDFDFFFEDLFQYYADYGVERIFLLQLEPFVLDGRIHQVPPRVTQQLVELHNRDQRPDLVERVIWHIDPDCLDINQAITLCRKHQLYDALIYVFTRAIEDFVLPVVELLGLIRKVQQHRRARRGASPNSQTTFINGSTENDILNAYKIYPYFANVLTGLTYPSEEPLPEDVAFRAKSDVYTFIFSSRSSIWPLNEGGQLVLTSDEENGVEPTYPYARLLLRFDPESFLHTLDLAFEDSYMNEDSRKISRLVIVKILFEILSTPDLSLPEYTFIHIFIARNVSKYKYTKDIQLAPSALQGILVGLAEIQDGGTREDRQLAAECLLSAYTPHDGVRILDLFEKAGFYRILQTSYRQEHQWVPLLGAYLQDPDLPPSDVFSSVEEVLDAACVKSQGILPPEILSAIEDSLPSLLNAGVARSASLIDRRLPNLHQAAYDALRDHSSRECYTYLRYLLGSPQRAEEDEGGEVFRHDAPSTHLPPSLKREYITLLCEFHPSAVAHELRYLPPEMLDWQHVLQACEDHHIYDTVIWALNYRGDPVAGLAKTQTINSALTSSIIEKLQVTDADAQRETEVETASLKAVASAAIAVCIEHSQEASHGKASADDLWIDLLKSQISSVHALSIFCTDHKISDPETSAMQLLLTARGLVQDTFTSLVSVSSTKSVSFPNLFKRLVDSTAEGATPKGAIYNEFRAILTGMLESYRGEEDMLSITKHLVDRDIFSNVELFAKERVRGWGPTQGKCLTCKKALHNPNLGLPLPSPGVVVLRTGAIYHDICIPREVDRSDELH